ncbi:MAG: hypothetical protein RLY71_4163 [Pseudomonadota bacterium]
MATGVQAGQAPARVASTTAHDWADLDARDFARIRDPGRQALAAESMADVLHEQPAYRARLESQAPAVAQAVRALAAENTERTQVKEARKATEFASITADRLAAGADRGPEPASPEIGRAERLQALDAAAERAKVRLPELANAHVNANESGEEQQLAKVLQAERAQALKATLDERYVVRDNEYRFRGEPTKVAFVDRGASLTTDLSTPSVARSMVDLAEAKGWDALRVRGETSYRRQVWIEASLRDVKVVGYEPSREDRELLTREREARQVNRIEQGPERRVEQVPVSRADVAAEASGERRAAAGEGTAAATAADGSARPGGRGSSRLQVMVAMRAALDANRVDAGTAERVMKVASQRLDEMARQGRAAPQVRVYDRSAPREAPLQVAPERETRDRTARGR